MKKMASKKRKKASLMKEKAPVREKKAPYIFFLYFQWGGRAPRDSCTCPLPWSPMSKNDNKINNIFRNYSSHNYIKNTL